MHSFPRSKHALWVLSGVVSTLALGVDQATKIYAEHTHLLAPPYPTMANHRASSEMLLSWGSGLQTANTDGSFLWVQVTHVANAGVIFGLLEDAPFHIPLLSFLVTTALALVGAVMLLRAALARSGALRNWLQVSAFLLSVGVLSNLLDRLRLGYVVDWLYLKWRWSGWPVDWVVDAPAFNFADLYIIAGSGLAAVTLVAAWIATSRERTQPQGRSA